MFAWLCLYILNPLALNVGEGLPAEAELTSVSESGVFLLNIWASWCAPCLEELPQLDELHDQVLQFGAGVHTINIDTDPAIGARFVQTRGLDLPVVYDPDGVVVRLFDPEALPTSYLINREGIIVSLFEGGLDSEAITEIGNQLRLLASEQ